MNLKLKHNQRMNYQPHPDRELYLSQLQYQQEYFEKQQGTVSSQPSDIINGIANGFDIQQPEKELLIPSSVIADLLSIQHSNLLRTLDNWKKSGKIEFDETQEEFLSGASGAALKSRKVYLLSNPAFHMVMKHKGARRTKEWISRFFATAATARVDDQHKVLKCIDLIRETAITPLLGDDIESDVWAAEKMCRFSGN